MPVYEIISGASIAVAALMLIVPGFFTIFWVLTPYSNYKKIFLKFAFKNKPTVDTQNNNKTIDAEIVENKNDNKDEL